MQDTPLTINPTSGSSAKRTRSKLSLALAWGISITSLLLMPLAASAEPEELEWARVDFLSNRVQLVPREQRSRRAQIADVLSIGDALRTARASRAELRFNDDSLARIGERATFRFTPNTRNFQLSNGTVLLLIPPGRGRSTIQTPNAVTGIQGSALFVRYIPETDTTIVGALTDNPEGPMVLFNEAGTERQALRSNEIGVVTGDRITDIYQFDGALFWQSSGLAEGFDYLSPPSPTGDPLDGVREEIREAISNQRPLNGDGVIENPDSFSRPAPPAPVEEVPKQTLGEPVASTSQSDSQSDSQPGQQADAQSNPQPGEGSGTVEASGSEGSPTSTIAADGLEGVNDAVEGTGAQAGIEAGSGSDPVGGSPVGGSGIVSETPATSEDIDLDVALDLELELELEADGVEAPALDINDTVQQYLEGEIAVTDLNGSSELGIENSLQSVEVEDTEDDVPVVSSSTSSTSEELTDGSETSDDSVDLPVAGDSTSSDELGSNSSDSTFDEDASNDIPAEGASDSADSTNGLSDSANSSIDSGLDSDSDSILPDDPTVDSTADSSLPPDQMPDPAANQSPVPQNIDTDSVADVQPEVVSVEAMSVDPAAADVPVDSPIDSTVTTSSPMTAEPLPTDVDAIAGDAAVDASVDTSLDASRAVNVVDILPAADEPPVEVFTPTDKVDDFMLMHGMEDGMDQDDHMADDMMDADDMMNADDMMEMNDSTEINGVLGDAVSSPSVEL